MSTAANSGVRMEAVKGREIEPYLDALAALRIEVFREYPYLYDGTVDYERKYLHVYAESARSVVALALDGDRVVGAATALPLRDHAEALAPQLAAAGFDPDRVYYFGESVLRRSYRGLGHAFFDVREAAARRHGFRVAAFCAVQRPDVHPRKPAGYVSHDAFWRKRGFEPRPDIVSTLEWQDLDEATESPKPMMYASVELTSALPAADRGDLARELRAIQTFVAPLETLFGDLAREHGAYILAPSFPVLVADGTFHNRAILHAPVGARFAIDKRQMTRFEREVWGISGGDGGPVIETELGVIGVAICYDSEFPLIVRRQVACGASIILVPSCTDTLAGYHRVALSCRARALENQCFVLQAPMVGEAPWSLALDHNHGSAAVFGPVDYGFASDGVIAQGALDTAGWVYADLDLESLARVRQAGQVTNHADWDLPGHLDYEPLRVRVA